MSGWRRLDAAWREEWQALLAFVRRPVRTARVDPAKAWRRRAFLVAVTLASVFAAGLPLLALDAWLDLENKLEDDAVLELLVWGVLVAPVVEEGLFRAGLRSLRWTLFVGPPIVVASLAIVFGDWLPLAIAIAVGCGVAAAESIVARRVARDRREEVALVRTFLRRYPLVFWTWTGAFALFHVANWSIATPAAGLLAPLLVLPQLAAGVVLGYARNSIGLGTAVALHATLNGVALGLAALLE